jgi:hypothetical protein
MYCAVRLLVKSGTTAGAGTGFFFKLFEGPERTLVVIVTNRHVVENMDSCSFIVHKLRLSRPTNDGTLTIDVSRAREKVFLHPTEDLAVIIVSEDINALQANGTPPFIVALDAGNIPSQDTLEAINPIEEILTVGYPGLFYDQSHTIPLFHSGHTATPIYLPFSSQIPSEDGKVIYKNSKTFSCRFHNLVGRKRVPCFYIQHQRIYR